MKRILCLLVVLAFAGVMLLPVASHVNQYSVNLVQTADGGGQQPPWPTIGNGVQMADGGGQQPPWPTFNTTTGLVSSLTV